MAANYDEVEDIVLAYIDAGVQGQRYADGGVMPLPQYCQICKKVGHEVSHAARMLAKVVD